jgi:hypothetical protein
VPFDAVGELLKEMRPILLLLLVRGDSSEDLSQESRYILLLVPGKMTQLLLIGSERSNQKSGIGFLTSPTKKQVYLIYLSS